MIPEQLRQKFNNEFGLSSWPEKYEVDHETYANICQLIFTNSNKIRLNKILWVDVSVGPNDGIMFKGVELILEKK